MKNRVFALFAATLACGCYSLAPLGNHSLILTPRVVPGNTTQALVNPYTQGSIAHLVLKLYSKPELQELAQKDLTNAQLGNPVVFSNLKPNSQYRIQAFAYKASGTATADLISSSGSWVDVAVLTDDRPVMAPLTVQLIDIDFNGLATGTLQITPGGYSTPGPEAMLFRHSQVSTIAGMPGVSGTADGIGSAARFCKPYGISIDNNGFLYVGDELNHTIRKVSPSGNVTTFAGSPAASGSIDGTGTGAMFNYPLRTAVDAGGNVYVSDYNNHTIRKISPSGVVTTLAGLAGATGTADGNGSNARFRNPCGLAVDSSGNLYVADVGNKSIRKITPAGDVTTFVGLPGTTGSADGSGSLARFANPYGLTIDGNGNLYLTDRSVHTVRKVTPQGVVSTIAGAYNVSGSSDGIGGNARFYQPHDLTVDASGNLFVSDSFNHCIRRISAAGIVTTLAGQPSITGTADGIGSNAQFSHPTGIVMDKNGNLVVTEFNSHTLRLLQ